MKHKLSVKLILIALITTTCESEFDVTEELEEELIRAEDARQIVLEPQLSKTDEAEKKQKQLIIAILKSKTIMAKYTLKIHKNDMWIENMEKSELYGMNTQSSAFHVAKNRDNNEVYATDTNKNARKQIYLALEHRISTITNFNEILNKLAEGADSNVNYAQNEHDIKTEYNTLIENILAEARKYAHNYFERALIPLYDKQDKLNSLSLDDLRELKDKFDELQKIRDTCKTYAETIYNDFKNDKDKIRTGVVLHLRNYINKNHYKYKFKALFKETEKPAYYISQILNKIQTH
ncbi:virulence associated lipoprotein [Borrelia coriaceae]|uniref:Putative membrane spanning protein n=1 Tax=Borrelia coriaceae ATCC 43381 TaxID=1408429 RepID=W5SWT7_9SPIR|nr:virulence associated lipoprotein [Borrelia coriaceae]AHH11168.1 Putative membrane spanning protein [Borrelia coriaceae ATCC 43381]